MTWRELSDFLHLQRRAIEPRLVADFDRIEKNGRTLSSALKRRLVNRLAKLCADLQKQKLGPHSQTSKY
jgi:hypothetical protein